MSATTAATHTSVPWDTSVGNRFARYLVDDHSAPLWIAVLLGFTYALGILIVRAVLKRRVLGWDDLMIVVGTVRHESSN